ncbi:nucleotidyltransferase family protein [Paracoccus gahaiensis]|uniref:Nucleotidyltransferase family protein n=1 Tax=Paracoccus gahaiensis TaxID=1706839 RepID=A0A4U0RG67_9RHOB|nr:nucleotidyltransferase family protein [Paracoccus gahaiensis]TJZ94066.1 nucleotidyltransferase family protein [Paracoccus gahaiensis]
MIRTGLLLAAGASRRFGPQDKLLALLHGQPLVTHAADALRDTPLDHRIAVIAHPELARLLDGFEIILIPPGQQSDSLRAGLQAAGQPDRLLIALGDMPDVTAAHLTRILTAATEDLPACSHDGTAPLPPACFPQARLADLHSLNGDQGAARLLQDLPPTQYIDARSLLRDIDTPDQIAPT